MTAPLTDRLDSTDMTILKLETRSPGPHHRAVGLTLQEYSERVSRMLYDPDANAFAGEAIARMRAELTHWTEAGA